MGATTFKMAKLYTTKGNVNGFKAMVAALYNGVPLQVPDNFDIATHASTAEYLAISPMGEVPCLQTACGAAISQPDAILRFVMRSNLAFLEAHLATRTFLVGQCVTGADIACALAMLDASTVIFDGAFREPFPNVFRWFMTCVNQPEFTAVIGEVTLCVEAKSAKPVKPVKEKKAQQPKQEKKKKEKKPKSDDDEEPAAVPVVKRVNPLDSLPKSTMVLDEFKRQYSNNEAPVFFDWLSKNFDAQGYCWYFAKYQFPNDF